MASSFLLFGSVIALLGAIGVQIAIAIIVYKDAKAHHINALLWAIIASLVPNFIGVVVYLVVRSNAEKEKYCSHCKAVVDSAYNICPQCRSVFEKICPSCKHAVSKEVQICPYCGEDVSQIVSEQTATKVSVKTNIAKPLGITLGIFLIGVILLFTAIFGVGVVGNMNMDSNISIMSTETNIGNQYSASFKYKSGTKHRTFNLDSEKYTGIRAEFDLDTGEVYYKLTDETDVVIFEETFTGEEGFKEVYTPIDKIGKAKYKLVIKYNKAGGSVKVAAETKIK